MEKVVITVDTREKDEEFLGYLKRFGGILDFQTLPIGDIGIYGDGQCYGIEHKSINDFANSLVSGRLFEQLKALVENANMGEVSYIPCLLLVGYEYKLWRGGRKFTDKQIAGVENSIQFDWGVHIIHAHNNRFAALRLISMAKSVQLSKEKRLHPLRTAHRKKMSAEEEARYVLEGFPGVSAVRARHLLEHYGTVENVLDAMRDGTIIEVSGIGKKIADVIKRVFRFQFEGGND